MLSKTIKDRGDAVPPALYDELHWYACYTYARHEKRVAALLVERGIESYLPLVPQKRQWKDRRTVVAMPAFASYVFGRFALTDLRAVYTTQGVATVVRVNGTPYPTPIPDEQIEQVRLVIGRAATFGVEVQPEEIAKGERVRVVGGPFRGVEGVVMQRRGGYRVLVALGVIGHGLSIEVELEQLHREPELLRQGVGGGCGGALVHGVA